MATLRCRYISSCQVCWKSSKPMTKNQAGHKTGLICFSNLTALSLQILPSAIQTVDFLRNIRTALTPIGKSSIAPAKIVEGSGTGVV
jgi:hypothetical protein